MTKCIDQDILKKEHLSSISPQSTQSLIPSFQRLFHKIYTVDQLLKKLSFYLKTMNSEISLIETVLSEIGKNYKIDSKQLILVFDQFEKENIRDLALFCQKKAKYDILDYSGLIIRMDKYLDSYSFMRLSFANKQNHRLIYRKALKGVLREREEIEDRLEAWRRVVLDVSL